MKMGLCIGSELPARETMGPHIESILRLVAIARNYGFDCTSELRRYETLGFNHLIAGFQHIGMEEALATNCLHLLGRTVLPQLHSAPMEQPMDH